MNATEEKNLAGCCGLYCGLCPRFQSKAPSRCPGCKILSLKISCKIFRCCVTERGFVTCAECGDFPCEGNNPETHRWDSFVSHKPCIPNLSRIREVGLEVWLKEQGERRLTLENLLANYNEGRSMSFYCRATALMQINLINEATDKIETMMANGQIDRSDLKAKAKALRSIIQDLASQSGIDLRLRKK